MRPAARGVVHALALVPVTALMVLVWVDLGEHNDPEPALLLGLALALVNFGIIAILRRLLSMAPAGTRGRR